MEGMGSMRKVFCTLAIICSVMIGSIVLAEEGTPITPSGGKFSLYSKPSGVLVYMEGDYDFVGRTPCELPFNLMGTYKVKALKRGYENWSTKVTLVDDRSNSLYIKLAPKTRLKAGLRSAVFPGWGQYYTDKKTKGTIFAFLEVGSLLASVFAYQNYEDAKDEYYLASSRYQEAKIMDDMPRLREEMEKTADDADKAYDVRAACFTVTAAIWAFNVVEAVLFFPRYEEGIYDRAIPLITGEIREGETRILLTRRF
jgi:hypothetical protein